MEEEYKEFLALLFVLSVIVLFWLAVAYFGFIAILTILNFFGVL